MKRIIAVTSASMLIVFNIIPVSVNPMLKASIKAKEIEVRGNSTLKIDYRAINKKPEPEYREVKAVITFYTASADECGNNRGITASGKKVSRGMIAAPRHIPFGTKIEIDGEIYIVEDRGGAIKVKDGVYYLDIYVPTKEEAFKKGRQIKMVRIYNTH